MFLSYFLAHLVRFENIRFLDSYPDFWVCATIVVVSRSIVFLFSGIYRSLWSYASLHDLLSIIKATVLSSLVSTLALLFYNRFHQLSRMVPILDTLILLGFLCLRSLSWRMLREQIFNSDKSKRGTPILLVGAGKLGSSFLTEIRRNVDLDYQPIGFLDDNLSKKGGYIQGVPILGATDEIGKILVRYGVKKVIMTVPQPDGRVVSKLMKECESAGVDFKILPTFGEYLSGKPNITQLREVQVEDLLGRPTVDLEIESIRSYLEKKVILVTGAGGSIGSEICRQVALFKPSVLVILDAAETPLYEIDYELRKSFSDLNIDIRPVIADVKNLSRISAIFEEHRPSVVFHSAAYKHVPMMEINPSEAVLNNVMGTKNVADVCRLIGVERFVLISTDKAVNPVNVMGASKRAAEIYLQHISQNSRTKFITVRFGNVLGSNGSVIPRFREQIKRGGPVTVTHPDVIRYFMTIPEATQLVLQAGSMGEHGEIFILDMGEPVKILSLAEEMIRLSGYTPHKDIAIEFSGLRPGEKLYEELLLNQEGIKKTHHPKIRIAAPLENYNLLLFQNKLNRLFSLAKANKNRELFGAFKEIIPEYKIHDEYIEWETSHGKRNL
ncbi:polysaccharide biosynthesis protein [Leptospira bourretii]|uniref:Polysaccharide biosynthesis protein n=2 Tax=Leptospiraceae TaxID=170 RepID=A0A4R9IQ81_9LEPT|nr:polysaccharide biosynthesis protein [Leptospira bourretii]TGK94069.1 polysaccharide biosynthesis protein [Leptospira bourretii]TGL26286.1 polysaccharide biosynthesis protein [Leptospira bourretii]TGL26331.1 polysaccharide biosynthesis protein [Leptospira bourretii]